MSSPQRWLAGLRERPGVLWALLLLALVLLFMERALLPPVGVALGGWDVRGLFYPWLSTAREAVLSGRLPLWDASLFGGYPFLANPQVGFFYPPAWLAILLPTRIGLSLYVALHLWLAGLGMLLFVRQMGGTWLGVGLAALTFAFSGFMAARIFAGHLGLIATDAWLPWMLLATHRTFRRGDVPSAVIAGVPFGLAILAGHTTSLIYVGMVWLGFVLWLLITRQVGWAVLRQLAIALAVGLALSAVQTLPFLEFSRVSSRSADPSFEFATGFSLPPVHLITFLIPDFFGEPIHAGYWSVPNFEELTYYVGVLPLIGLLVALRRPTRLTWFYVGLIAFGVLVALGSYGFLYRLLYDLLPPFRLARAPARAAFLFVFGASALLGEVITRLQRHEDRGRILSRVMPVIGAIVGVAGLAATGAVFAAQHPTDTSGRLWHQAGGWTIVTLLLAIGGALLWQLSHMDTSPSAERSRPTWLPIGLILVLLTDLWLFGFKLIRLESMAPAAIWSDAKQMIGDTQQRVLPWGVSIFEQNGAGQVGLNSIFGYNALEVASNQAFAASIPDPRSTAYDILGVEYVVAGVPLDQYTQGDRPLGLVGNIGPTWVYRRDRVLPIARLVYDFEAIPSTEAAIARVHAPDFDPAATAILSADPGCDIGPAPATPGTARILEAQDGRWLIETRSDAPALLVLSETAYPGWQAAVEGESIQPLTAYTAVKAVCVPTGAHRVEWIYSGSIYWAGAGVSLAALTAVVTIMIMAGIANLRFQQTAAANVTAEEKPINERVHVPS